MKKLIATLIIIIATTSSSICQTSSDSTVCVPTVQLKKAINLIEKGKVQGEELAAIKAKVTELETLLGSKELTINQFMRKDSLNMIKSQAYQSIIDNMSQSLKNGEEITATYKKQLKTQKLSKWGALAIGFGIGFLTFKK